MGSRSPREGAILRGKTAAHCTVQRFSAMNFARMAEPIKMPFGTWTLVGPRKHVLGGGATWQIPLNCPCAVAMRTVVCQITLTTCYYHFYY